MEENQAMILWIVGQVNYPEPWFEECAGMSDWELIGIFDSEEEAKKIADVSNASHDGYGAFIRAVELNKPISIEK